MKKRYFISLVLATCVYGVSFLSFNYYRQEVVDSQIALAKNQSNIVKIALYQKEIKEVEPKQEEKKEKIIKKKLPKVVKKITPQKVLPKEIVKNTEEKSQVIKTKQERSHIKKIPKIAQAKNYQIKSTPILAKDENQIILEKETDLNDLKKNLYLDNIKRIIESNKFYPSAAKRRGLSGNVDVKFVILQDGSIKDIKIISGRQAFYNSVKKTLEMSFPQDPAGILKEELEVRIVLKYALY